MRLQLVTLGGVKYDKDIFEVILPTPDGNISVFANHEPLVTVVSAGVITVVDQAGDTEAQFEHFATEGGIVEIKNDIRVLVDEASHSSEIVEEEAKNALERAHKMREEAKDRISLDHAQSLVDRETTRLQVAEIRRRHRR